METLLACVAEQALVDHHCHGLLYRDADEATLESMLNEGAAWPGGSMFDSQAGFAFRRLCPPVLGLPPHAALPDYVLRRAELGPARGVVGQLGVRREAEDGRAQP
ncbi:MAG TPA: hypothetical protein VJ370_12490, partial [Streptosporangiaceae bacterium]|nr:hypothetical protein [Streptosporangiaceae bacterium]